MVEKRRDSRGRILHNGESQRPNGMYEFKFMDSNGTRRSVYSWKLVATDKLPAGKRKCEALRDIERTIVADINDDINTFEGNKRTLNDFFAEYMNNKFDLKRTTRRSYKFVYKKYIYNDFGKKKITDIKYSDIKNFLTRMVHERSFKPSSLNAFISIIHPIFDQAVKDRIIRFNPADGVLKDVLKGSNIPRNKRHPLTKQEQARFIEFISTSERYAKIKLLMTVLMGTGCRIGEALGLIWEDCDFEDGIIHINRTQNYGAQEDGRCEFHISTPKTPSGKRIVPMFSTVKEALMQEFNRQEKFGHPTFEIDGYTNFVFFGKNDMPLSSGYVNMLLRQLIKDANKEEQEKASAENRDPVILPKFSCHHLRHTFCTRLCENETNLKVIQEIMGHSNISTTMNIYNEATQEKKLESFDRLDGILKLS